MNTKRAVALLKKYEAGTISAEEKALLETWYIQQAAQSNHQLSGKALDDSFYYLKAQLPVQPAKRMQLWPRIAVAAAAVVAVVFGVWFYTARHLEGSAATRDLLVNDIAPGKNGATITLASGKVIALSGDKKGVIIGNGTLVYDDGSALSPGGRDGRSPKRGDGSTDPSLSRSDISPSRGERGMMLTASTTKGQTYEFTLPDGTHVWLNADSKISFPNQFVGRERKILLNGEAYFEVAKLTRLSPPGRDGRRPERVPFIVESKDQQVEVLGTHFNLNTYDDALSSTVTSLLEGSVKVTGKGGARILKPGERGINTIKGVMLLRGSAEDDIDWKNGDFVFEEESLASIMRKVSRWYDVDVIYGADVDQNQTFGGKVSRKRNISQVIKALQTTQALKFKIEGKKIYITN
ncbi:MAG: FecR domain-containing protein [Bacteroidota bacterium]